MSQLPVIDKYAARLLMVSFFLPMQWQVWSVMAVSVYFAVRTVSAKQQIPKSNFVWALIIGSVFLLFLFAIPVTPAAYKETLLSICEHRVSFLLMPLVFAIIAPAYGEVIRRELLWFVYGCFVTSIVSNIFFIRLQYFTNAGTHALSHVFYRSELHEFTGIHPTYMAMYLCFSICILLFSETSENSGGRIIKYTLIYLLLLFFLAILAKSPLIALLVIVVHYSYAQRKNLYQYKFLLAGILLSVVAAWRFIPFFSQRVNEAIQFSGHSKSGNAIDNSVYARKLIWSVDMSLLKDYWLTGIGPGRLFQAFQERFFFQSLSNNFGVVVHDPHNEYLYEWICFGILGILLFAGILLIHLIKAIRTKDCLYLYLLITLYITFFTETVLATQHGVVFYAVFTSMFFFRNKPPTLKGEFHSN